ncbi:MAG: sporulation protein YtfJ [Clostridia bacterium]|nr:sporulation protein YtfJ [Clostridia bacterium]MBR4973155.1 sporulation protein YtfJ [Clostridia bacterium]
MSENNIKGILDVTMEKLRGMINADIITGAPVVVDGITLIPVSRVSYGLATGGSDFPSKTGKELFGGGGGAGVTVVPVAFVTIKDGNVKMLPIYNDLTTVEKAISMAPELVDKAKELFKKDKNNKE